MVEHEPPAVSLATIAACWARIGITGFGGPPAHIALLRRLCVTERAWLSEQEFEDGIAATGLLPGPASTQLSIWCAWKLRGIAGATLGGLCFIVPGLIIIIVLAAIFLAADPPRWILGAAAGSGAAVPIVAVQAAVALIPASRRRIGAHGSQRLRWFCYLLAGVGASAVIGALVVVVLVICGFIEVSVRRERPWRPHGVFAVPAHLGVATVGSLGALAWVAFKVGALSYGGGFVIIPLMQHDAVVTYHWMTGAQFLNAVALGQLTPGPVVQTISVVGYAAGGVPGALLGAAVAFAPSFAMILVIAPHFDRLRANTSVAAFLTGAGPAAIGAILGSALALGLELSQGWQLVVLAAAALWILALHRSVVSALLLAGASGTVVALFGMALPG